MRPTDLHIRRATPEDEPALLDLVRLSLGEGAIPRTLAYWRWKHTANPFGHSSVLIAEAEGRLVGLRAFMRWAWQSGGRAVPAVRAVDTATHPDYRGRGIFKQLTLQLRDEMEAEGVAFVFNTPNAQSRPGYLKMGWTLVGKPTLWVRPVRPVRLARALRSEGLGGDETAPPPIHAASAGDVLARPEVRTLVASSREIPRAEAYHTFHDLDYLSWRYVSIPGFGYHALAQGGGRDGALALVRTRRRGAVRELRVCDLVVGSTDTARRNARALLRSLPRIADVDVVIGMRPLGLSTGAMASAGYLPVPRTGPILTAYPLFGGDGLLAPGRLANWQPSVGALELF